MSETAATLAPYRFYFSIGSKAGSWAAVQLEDIPAAFMRGLEVIEMIVVDMRPEEEERGGEEEEEYK
ncbi:hypothetical protein [Acidomonas methanolica]|uniref:hypothetical protein n=1 Tax=Acidomonas methanolica TaxID=437 RepID=UPI002119FB8C|nr:hypothetical protein [Acidomonas methanolica]MCQ9155133.1 hypothetical protein [Acidomonas methanolica]